MPKTKTPQKLSPPQRRELVIDLKHVEGSATVEKKRELSHATIQKIKADPDQQSVQIGLYPTLLSQKIEWPKPFSNR